MNKICLPMVISSITPAVQFGHNWNTTNVNTIMQM